MNPIKLPFGLNENNILVHVTDVERGKNCNCVCPDCKFPLIASKGSQKQPHFKHAVETKCEGEGAIHLAAKQIIRERKKIALPEYNITRSVKDSRGKQYSEFKALIKNGSPICFDSVQEEVILPGMKADLLAQKGSTPLLIEIFYRHKVDDEKRLKIVEANISALEIDLSDLAQEDVKDINAFWLYINDPKNIKWLHNSKSKAHYLELEERLIKKIQLKEQEYKQEEIRKQKREQRGRELLLPSINELKILSSQESIAQLRRQAETHPFWKDNARFIPFSFNNLPNFVNVDVPDGDWIYGCDRRIWQTAFYKSFIFWSKNKPFCVKLVDDWLQNKVGFKVNPSVKIVNQYWRLDQQIIPDNIYNNRPSSWKTLRRYFYYLWDLGIIEFSGEDHHNPGNDWFRVISKEPKHKK